MYSRKLLIVRPVNKCHIQREVWQSWDLNPYVILTVILKDALTTVSLTTSMLITIFHFQDWLLKEFFLHCRLMGTFWKCARIGEKNKTIFCCFVSEWLWICRRYLASVNLRMLTKKYYICIFIIIIPAADLNVCALLNRREKKPLGSCLLHCHGFQHPLLVMKNWDSIRL